MWSEGIKDAGNDKLQSHDDDQLWKEEDQEDSEGAHGQHLTVPVHGFLSKYLMVIFEKTGIYIFAI